MELQTSSQSPDVLTFRLTLTTRGQFLAQWGLPATTQSSEGPSQLSPSQSNGQKQQLYKWIDGQVIRRLVDSLIAQIKVRSSLMNNYTMFSYINITPVCHIGPTKDMYGNVF